MKWWGDDYGRLERSSVALPMMFLFPIRVIRVIRGCRLGVHVPGAGLVTTNSTNYTNENADEVVG